MTTAVEAGGDQPEILPTLSPPPPVVSPGPKSRYALDAKWDACLDLTIRRLIYSSFAGAVGGLLFFRSRTTRWASVAFGAGVGSGSAYTECSYMLSGSRSKLAPRKEKNEEPRL